VEIENAGAVAWRHGVNLAYHWLDARDNPIVWDGTRTPAPALAPYEPGSGRVPGFGAPLLCPSVLPGVELERLGDVAGLPAYAAPKDEPWIYDGRAVLTARPRSGRRPT
jgi:hypothetical protein